jgi:hypothetical protein
MMAIDTGNSFAVLANSQPAGAPRVQLMGNGEPIETEVEVGLFITPSNSDIVLIIAAESWFQRTE